MKKKRLPIEQLREAGKIAHQMLIDKGILAKDSVIDKMMHDKNAPVLPGIPPYIPHQWTIKSAQQMMYDLLIIWKEETKDDDFKRESITEFFKFVVTEMRTQEKKFQKEMKKVPKLFKAMKKVPVLSEVFSPMRKHENTKAIHHFFVDSFTVAIVLKNAHNVGDYANWFLDWTEELLKVWVQNPKEEMKELTTKK